MTQRSVPRLRAEERAAFIEAVGSLMTAGHAGQPVIYRPYGRNVLGVDCIGVPIFGLNRLGYDVVDDQKAYSLRPDGSMLRRMLVGALGEPIGRHFARAGDVVLMRWHEDRKNRIVYHNHVGVLMPLPYDPPKVLADLLWKFSLLHAYQGQKAVTRHAVGEPWDRRIVEVYSLTGRSA